MRRRTILTATAVGCLAGCLGDTGDNEQDDGEGPTADDGDDTGDDVDPPDGGGGDSNEGDDDADAPFGPVPTTAVHHWPVQDREDDIVRDVIGGADGRASDGIETVSGDWIDEHAESSPDGEGYVDLDYLDTINEAAEEGSLSILATIRSETVSDRHMTILGAGGGEADWFEFGLNASGGEYPGQPVLFISDGFGAKLSIAADHAIEDDTPTRIVVRVDELSGDGVEFWINGEEVDTDVIYDEGLSTDVSPDQSYGLFASNPQDPGSIGTRRWFTGTIDNILLCDGPVDDDEIERDYRGQPWS